MFIRHLCYFPPKSENFKMYRECMHAMHACMCAGTTLSTHVTFVPSHLFVHLPSFLHSKYSSLMVDLPTCEGAISVVATWSMFNFKNSNINLAHLDTHNQNYYNITLLSELIENDFIGLLFIVILYLPKSTTRTTTESRSWTCHEERHFLGHFLGSKQNLQKGRKCLWHRVQNGHLSKYIEENWRFLLIMHACLYSGDNRRI